MKTIKINQKLSNQEAVKIAEKHNGVLIMISYDSAENVTTLTIAAN